MAATPESSELLTSDAMNRIGNLELLSTRVVDGVLSGKHRSTYLGGSFEFANHRAYSPGDSIRMIDWKVYARRDRYYVRQFEETTSLQGLMVVDCSGSMQFGQSTVSKLNYWRVAAVCLARLMLRQRDGVGLGDCRSEGRTVHSATWIPTASAGDPAGVAPNRAAGKRSWRRACTICRGD